MAELQHDCETVVEGNDDYITIKRQFVLDAIDIGLSRYITDDDKLTLEGMGIAVSELPSVQPEQRKKGEWIRITQGAIPEKYMCPFCHRMVEHEGIEDFVSIIYPFCHCGADMRKLKLRYGDDDILQGGLMSAT